MVCSLLVLLVLVGWSGVLFLSFFLCCSLIDLRSYYDDFVCTVFNQTSIFSTTSLEEYGCTTSGCTMYVWVLDFDKSSCITFTPEDIEKHPIPATIRILPKLTLWVGDLDPTSSEVTRLDADPELWMQFSDPRPASLTLWVSKLALHTETSSDKIVPSHQEQWGLLTGGRIKTYLSLRAVMQN